MSDLHEQTLSERLIRKEITQKEYDYLIESQKWKVGVRVLCEDAYDERNTNQLKGTIVHINKYFKGRIHDDIGIEFDQYMNGHNCNGHAKEGHGWYIPLRKLKIIES